MLVEMELKEIMTSNGGLTAIIVLAEKEGGENRQFPIYIGPYEAKALEMALHNQVPPRPFTHDLILNVIDGVGATINRVIVDQLVEEDNQGTFHGKLDLTRADGENVWVDSRPSDAMVLATKCEVPVFVEEDVLDRVAAEISSDEDLEDDEDDDDDDED